MSGTEVLIGGMEDVTTALQTMAKKTRLSMTALVSAGGVENGSLVSIGTGKGRTKDLSLGPLFRVMQAINWELVGRTQDPRGIVITPEGGVDLLITAGDGGRLEVPMFGLQDVPLLLNTMAAANGLTISGLNNAAGLGGGSLVGVARGTAPNQDIRLNGLVKITAAAKFELLVRPVHATLREARMALAAARRN